MASTTTYLQAVNSVLRAVGSPSVGQQVFTVPAGEPNAREVRQAKEIVREVYEELQNDRPDSFWEKSAELRLYAPFREGGIIAINSGTPGEIDFAFTGADNLETIPWMGATSPVTMDHTMLHITGERQYYRCLVRQSSTRLTTESENIENVGYNDPASPLGYALFRFIYDLPSDFRDILNVYNPYVGTDLRQMGAERIVEAITDSGYLVTTAAGAGGWGADPDFYSLWRGDDGKPKLVVYPIPVEDRILTIRYQASRSKAISLYNDKFDMDEDYIPYFLNLCKARAAAEIIRDTTLAGMYEEWASRGKRNAQVKSLETGGEFQRIRPTVGEDYRAHYASRELRDGQRGIYLRR